MSTRGWYSALARGVLVINLLAALLNGHAAVRADEASDARRAIESQYAIIDKGADHHALAQALYSVMTVPCRTYTFTHRKQVQINSPMSKMSPAEKDAVAKESAKKWDIQATELSRQMPQHMQQSETRTTIDNFGPPYGQFNGPAFTLTVTTRFKITFTDPATGKQITKSQYEQSRDTWIKEGRSWKLAVQLTNHGAVLQAGGLRMDLMDLVD